MNHHLVTEYRALNGTELLKFIFSDAYEKLAVYDAFRQHLTYHNPKYKLTLEVVTADLIEGSGTMAAIDNGPTAEVVGGKVTIPPEELPSDPQYNRIKLEVRQDKHLIEPDRARDKMGGRTHVGRKDGVLVDVEDGPPAALATKLGEKVKK